MNPYIEFAQWAITNWRNWWISHGTKILGWLLGTVALAQIVLESISGDPEFKLLVTPKQFSYLHLVNLALSAIVVKRGFTNTKNTPPPGG